MRAVSFVATSVVIAFLAGCAGSTMTDSATGGPPANVAGSWSGWTADGLSVSLVLKQDGGAVTGTIAVGGRPDNSGPLTGTVKGNAVSFRLDSGYGSTSDLRVAQDTISGIVGGRAVNLRRN